MKEPFLPFPALSLINYFPIPSLFFIFLLFSFSPLSQYTLRLSMKEALTCLKWISDTKCIHEEKHRKWQTHREINRETRDARVRKCVIVLIPWVCVSVSERERERERGWGGEREREREERVHESVSCREKESKKESEREKRKGIKKRERDCETGRGVCIRREMDDWYLYFFLGCEIIGYFKQNEVCSHFVYLLFCIDLFSFPSFIIFRSKLYS